MAFPFFLFLPPQRPQSYPQVPNPWPLPNEILVSPHLPLLSPKEFQVLRKMFFNSKAMAASSENSGVLQILWQALQLPAKTATFFFPLLVLTLVCSSCVFYANFSCISPVLMDLFSKLSILLKGPGPGPEFSHVLLEIKNDLKQVAGFESIITLLSFFSSLLLLLATVYSFAMAYSDTSLTLKQLLARVARRWYQTLVTRLYVVLLSLGFGVLSSLVIGTAMLLCDDSKLLMSSGLALSAGAASAIFIYLWTRWSMSFVITVVEETWGIGALSWSVELFIGNKKTGWTVTFILTLLKMVIYGIFGFMMMSGKTPPPPPPPPSPPPMDDPLRIGFLAAAASALLDMYAMAVYTVFYYECRKSHGLDETVKVEGGVVYTSLPAAAAAAAKIGATTFP